MIGRRLVLGWVTLLAAIGCGTRHAEKMKMPASGTMMAGDSMAMMAKALLPRVRANLDSLESATPALRDSARAHHSAVMESLLRAMRTDLMHLGLHRDPRYLALADSVSSDSAAGQPELVHRQVQLVTRLLGVYDELVARGMH